MTWTGNEEYEHNEKKPITIVMIPIVFVRKL